MQPYACSTLSASGNMEAAVAWLRDFRRTRGLGGRSAIIPSSPWQASELPCWVRFHTGFPIQRSRPSFLCTLELLGTAGYVNPAKSGLHSARTPTREEALYRIFDSLMQPRKPTQIGSGNLDYYKRITELEAIRNPERILSVLLNRASPGGNTAAGAEAASYSNVRKAKSCIGCSTVVFLICLSRASVSALLRAFSGYGRIRPWWRGLEELSRSLASSDFLYIRLLVADSQAALAGKEECWKTYDTCSPMPHRQSREPY